MRFIPTRLPRIPCIAPVLSAVLIIASGCRTYGKYGGEEELDRQIERLTQRFEEAHVRAQADLSALEGSGSSVLQAVAQEYGRLVEEHQQLLNEQRELTENLSPGSTYRALRRAFGSIVSEQRTLRSKYQGLLRHAIEIVEADTSGTVEFERPYALIPPYYLRVAEMNRRTTVNDLLRRTRGGADAGLDGSPADTTSMGDEGPGASEAPGGAQPEGSEAGEPEQDRRR